MVLLFSNLGVRAYIDYYYFTASWEKVYNLGMEVGEQSTYLWGIITGIELVFQPPGVAINLIVQNQNEAAVAYLGREDDPTLTPDKLVDRAQRYDYLMRMYALAQRSEESGEKLATVTKLYSTKRELLRDLTIFTPSSNELISA